jgi:hypothetical protein
VIRISKERSLVKFREQLNDAAGSAASFKSVIKGDRLTTVAPQWGILSDPRRADALGFTVETTEEIKPVKWTEARPDELPQDSNAGASGSRASRDVTT